MIRTPHTRRLTRLTALAVGLAVVAVTAGCAPDVTHGTITSKTYRAASTHTEMSPIYGTRCSTVGKRQSCRTTITGWFPQRVTDPECYRLALRNGKHRGSVCVSPADYARVRVGQTW